MKRAVGAPQIPTPTQADFLPPKRGYEWAKKLTAIINKWAPEISDTVSTHGQNKGVTPTVPSAATLTVKAEIMHVTGTAAISQLVIPPNFGGQAQLIADDQWTLVTGGNIAAAASPQVGQTVIVTYDSTTKMWYPSAGASGGGGGGLLPIIFRCDATSGTFDQLLPAATTVGQVVVVQKIDSSMNGVVVEPAGSDLINGVHANVDPITQQWDTVRLMVVEAGSWAFV